MSETTLRVLFLCTGNSARSQMAEALLRAVSNGRIEVASAGSDPRPEIHPVSLDVLRKQHGIEPVGQYPKHWDRFAGQKFDYVITLCARAAERCPVFPGEPERIQWHFDDPVEAIGTETDRRRAFERTATELMARMRIWLALPRQRKALQEA